SFSRRRRPTAFDAAGCRSRRVQGKRSRDGADRQPQNAARTPATQWETSHRTPSAALSMPPGAAPRAWRGRNAEILLEGGAVARELGAGALVDHGAALEDHRAFAHAQDFLRILLD